MAGPPLPYTHLSLQEFGRIMGVNPVHLMGAVGGTSFPLYNNACTDLITRYSYQFLDAISHDDIVREIKQAEDEIAAVLGYYVAPQWVSQEIRQFPRFYRPDVFRLSGTDVRGMRVGLDLGKGKIIAPGQRAVGTSDPGTATVAGGTLVYTDVDLDQFFETATITLPTALTNVCEIKVYYPGYSGDPRYEIRPVRSKTITGGNVVIVIDTWNMILLSLLEAYPDTAGWQGINLATNNSTPFVQSVDVYREYNDTTAVSATFYWEPQPRAVDILCGNCGGSGCVVCQLTTQNGCFVIRDPEVGVVVPAPASYSASAAAWQGGCFTVRRDPDFVKFYYYSGAIDEEVLAGDGCRVLNRRLANAVASLAAARLGRPLCQCHSPTARANYLQTDLAVSSPDGDSYTVSEELLSNPFGTRRGEIMAWREVSKMPIQRRLQVAII